MPARLVRDSYGKSAVRLVKVERDGPRHTVRDLTIDIRFEGEFAAAHTAGDNSAVLPTDTMKNTVYALARLAPLGEPEAFGRRLTHRFLEASAAATRVTVDLAEHPWERIGGHDSAFERAGGGERTARVTAARDGDVVVESGVADLTILKSSRSAFRGYERDRYTTLPETSDRILATALTARWRHVRAAGEGGGDASDQAYGVLWRAVRRTLLATFADHDSQSVQHTLYAMGEAVLEECGTVEEIELTMPNRHHLLVDLSPFGLTNENAVFVATEAPYGLISAVLRRSE